MVPYAFFASRTSETPLLYCLQQPLTPPARRKLAEHGIGCTGKTARQLTRADYDQYDLLIGMDKANLRNMRRICGAFMINSAIGLRQMLPWQTNKILVIS